MRRGVALALLLGACATPITLRPSLYERIAARVKGDPHSLDRAAAPVGDREKVAALVGHWRCPCHVFATPSTPERDGKVVETWHFERDEHGDLAQIDDEATVPWRSIYLAWDGRATKWINPRIDRDAYGIGTSPGWKGNKLVTEGDITIVGESTHIRSTYELVDANHFTLLNEELGLGGPAVPLDLYRCERLPDAQR